jgi:hypothetical protein
MGVEDYPPSQQDLPGEPWAKGPLWYRSPSVPLEVKGLDGVGAREQEE